MVSLRLSQQDQPLVAEPLLISSSRHPSKELQTRRLESVNRTKICTEKRNSSSGGGQI